MRIWLDDERDPTTLFIQQNFGAVGDEKWIKTAEELIPLVKSGGVTYISFDHDLGEGKSGYDVAKVIEEEAYHGRIARIQWQVHSTNSVGNKNITVGMKSADSYWDKFRITCDGCQRLLDSPHKMCPAWGTPKYMSGELFTTEDEQTYKVERDAAMERARQSETSNLD